MQANDRTAVPILQNQCSMRILLEASIPEKAKYSCNPECSPGIKMPPAHSLSNADGQWVHGKSRGDDKNGKYIHRICCCRWLYRMRKGRKKRNSAKEREYKTKRWFRLLLFQLNGQGVFPLFLSIQQKEQNKNSFADYRMLFVVNAVSKIRTIDEPEYTKTETMSPFVISNFRFFLIIFGSLYSKNYLWTMIKFKKYPGRPGAYLSSYL